jgi:hypothetical protein
LKNLSPPKVIEPTVRFSRKKSWTLVMVGNRQNRSIKKFYRAVLKLKIENRNFLIKIGQNSVKLEFIKISLITFSVKNQGDRHRCQEHFRKKFIPKKCVWANLWAYQCFDPSACKEPMESANSEDQLHFTI